MDRKPVLYIMCGAPCSGKSTFAHDFIKNNDIRYVSRDEIRFSILEDDEDYFSHENEVFYKFMSIIRATLIDGFDVIADATHLNLPSRHKLTSALDEYYKDYQIIYIVMGCSLDICLKRNSLREGRAKVPDEILEKMWHNFRMPTKNEDDRAIGLWVIKGDFNE